MLIIREAVKEDLAALSKLYTEFFRYNAGLQPGYYLPAEEAGDYPLSVMEGESGVLFVAEEDGELVGLAHLETGQTPPYPSVVAHQFGVGVDLYVTPAYRRRGIATGLLNRAKEWVRECELDYFELMVLHNNPEAIAFYQKEGFRITSLTMRLE